MDEAVKWFHKSAQQGNAQAYKNLGVCYQAGLGVSKDHLKAVELFRQAVERGRYGLTSSGHWDSMNHFSQLLLIVKNNRNVHPGVLLSQPPPVRPDCTVGYVLVSHALEALGVDHTRSSAE